MKKLFSEIPDVQQGVANKVVRVIERHFRFHKVTRANDLSEEARVRLHRDLRALFDVELGSGGSLSADRKRRAGVLEKIHAWLKEFLG